MKGVPTNNGTPQEEAMGQEVRGFEKVRPLNAQKEKVSPLGGRGFWARGKGSGRIGVQAGGSKGGEVGPLEWWQEIWGGGSSGV